MTPRIFVRHLALISIIFLTILVWFKTLFQSPTGEGFYYFDHGQDFISANGHISNLWGLDNFAKIMFDVLPIFFRDNLWLYFAFQLAVLILLNLTFFYFIKHFSKNTWISFSATIFFLSSYVGLFEMVGIGNYQRFAQRVPNLIPELLSFILLDKFLEKGFSQKKLLFYSIALFSLSILMGHFSTFLLPLFMIYPVIKSIFNRQSTINIAVSCLVAVIYLGVNFMLVSQDPLKPDTNIVAFIQTQGILNLLQKIALQAGNIVIPPFIIEKVAAISSPYRDTIILLTIPIASILCLGFFVVRKVLPKFTIVYLVSIVLIPILLFLNLYLGKVDPEFNMRGYYYYFTPTFFTNQIDTIQVKGDRYYLVPMFFLAIIYATLIWSTLSLFIKSDRIKKTLLITITAIYYVYNTSLIWHHLDNLQPISEIMKKYIAYNKSISNQFNSQTTVVSTRALIWPASFIRTFYGNQDMQFVLFTGDWESEIKSRDRKNVFIIDYDYRLNTIIDLSEQYRENKLIPAPRYQ